MVCLESFSSSLLAHTKDRPSLHFLGNALQKDSWLLMFNLENCKLLEIIQTHLTKHGLDIILRGAVTEKSAKRAVKEIKAGCFTLPTRRHNDVVLGGTDQYWAQRTTYVGLMQDFSNMEHFVTLAWNHLVVQSSKEVRANWHMDNRE